MKQLLAILFVASFQTAFAETIPFVDTTAEIRTSPCRKGYDVYEAGDYKALGSDPFFDWDSRREKLFGLKTKECIHLPFWVDDAKGLQLSFLAPLAAINEVLKAHDVEALAVNDMQAFLPQQLRDLLIAGNPDLKEANTDFANQTLITLVVNDFANSSAGPIHPAQMYVWTKPDSDKCYLGKEACALPSLIFLNYYVDSLRAKYAGEQPWGLVKKMGSARYRLQDKARKSVAYFDEERKFKDKKVFALEWNSQEFTQANTFVNDKGFEIYSVSTTVKNNLRHSPGQTYNLIKWKVGRQILAPFDGRHDRVQLNFDYEFLRPMKGLDAKPFFWSYSEDMKIIYHADQPPR